MGARDLKSNRPQLRLAVTGSSGRIGQAILDAWDDDSAIGFDRDAGRRTTVIGDIRDESRLSQAFEGYDVVIHAAALHAPDVGRVADAEFEAINVEGTLSVLSACRAAGVGRFILTSTTAVYGGGAALHAPARWITELTPPAPRSIYHYTKLDAEAAVRTANSPNFRTAIVRLGRCFPEPANVVAFHRLGRGIDTRDAAAAHLMVATTDFDEGNCALFMAVGASPFRRSDAAMMGINAAEVIRHRLPTLAEACDKRGWELPSSIDRVYDASETFRKLRWFPRYGPEAILRGDCETSIFS